MKIKFNEIDGEVVEDNFESCRNCVFDNTEFCKDIDGYHPLFVLCKNSTFLKSNLDIFKL